MFVCMYIQNYIVLSAAKVGKTSEPKILQRKISWDPPEVSDIRMYALCLHYEFVYIYT